MRDVKGARAVVTGALVALVLAGGMGGAHASPPTAATGTITQEAITGFELRLGGPNIIIEQSTTGSVGGTLTGTYEDTFTVVIHPNGRFNAHGRLTCQCTVKGEQGLLELVVTNTGEELNGVPTFEGRFVIKGGTGDLSGLSGVLDFVGTVDVPSGLSTITYSGQVHSHP